MNKVTSHTVALKAKEYAALRIPYRHEGRTRDGVDCSGLLCLLCRELGIIFVDAQSSYGRQGYEKRLQRHLAVQLIPIPVKEAAPGDIGLFWMDEGSREPQHTSFFVDSKTGSLDLVHAVELHKRVVRHHFNLTWQRRLVQVYRFPLSLVWRDGWLP